MRILRVAQKAYPAHLGGGAFHVHALSRDQAAMGHDVTVLTLAAGSEAPGETSRDGYRVVRARPRVELVGNQLAPRVWRQLRAGTYDVVHAHSHLYFSTNLASLNRVVDDRPLAVTNHGLYSQSAPQWLFGPYLRTLGRWTLNRADLVFCYTDTDERRLRQIGVATDVAVVSNGIDVDQFTPGGPVHRGTSFDDPVLLVTGRLVGGKNPGHALAAARRLRERGEPVQLVFCGDGPLQGQLESRVAATDSESFVHFLGRVPNDDMPAVYRGADILVQPSRAEGFPRTVLEAFATEVPAVTSALPQLQPVVEKAGRTATLDDVDELVDRLRELLGDPELRDELGQRGRRLVTERFRWSETVRRTTARLKALASAD